MTRSERTRKQAQELQKAIGYLAKAKLAQTVRHSLREQPFDCHLLIISKIYRKSREVYLKSGGKFFATLLSSPRSLSSPILLESKIEYSPIEREYIWAATDPLERKNWDALLRLRSFCTSVYHEQNHRVLWKHLPPCPRRPAQVRRYLNFAESLVIALDTALGDELGELGPDFHLTGVTYDPGSEVRRMGLSRREYRNYLQAILHATYLNLELYSERDIVRVVRALFPNLGKLAERAALRSSNLDRSFIQRTNYFWQKKHYKGVVRTLSGPNPLILSDNPIDNRLQYLFAEKWFEFFGL